MRFRGWLLGAVLLGGAGGGIALAQASEGVQTAAMETAKALQNDPLLEGTAQFAQGATDVTEVNLDKNLMAMAARFIGKDDADGRRLMEKMEFVYVKSYTYANAGQYRMEDVAKLRERLEDPHWSHVVRNRSATESTDVWMKADGNGDLSELLVIAAEPKELTFVHLKGHMTMEELTRAGEKYGVPQAGTKTQKGAK